MMFAELLEFLVEIVIKSSQNEKDNQIMKFTIREENNALSRDLIHQDKYRFNFERSKNELFLKSRAQLFYMKQLPNSYQLFYFKDWFITQARNSPNPLQFFTKTDNIGIYFWEYDCVSEEYNSLQMLTEVESGEHNRGQMNDEGIYVAAGSSSNNVYIYDMKYYNYPDHKIQLLHSSLHSNSVNECFFKNSVSAICCDNDGYLKEYDLSNLEVLPPPTIIYNSSKGLKSCMQTKDKKHIVAGLQNELYILDAEGSLQHTLDYGLNEGWYVSQIAEIRANILATVDYNRTSIHDIRDLENIPPSVKLPDVGKYYKSVVALESNPGDFAIGGQSVNTDNGFVYILHLEEDNQTVNTLKSADNIEGNFCVIQVIKELKTGVIVFGGDTDCTVVCLWNYDAPDLAPSCWGHPTSTIWDILMPHYI